MHLIGSTLSSRRSRFAKYSTAPFPEDKSGDIGSKLNCFRQCFILITQVIRGDTPLTETNITEKQAELESNGRKTSMLLHGVLILQQMEKGERD